MVQRVVRGAVDELLERVSGDHIGVVDEDGPEVDDDEENEDAEEEVEDDEEEEEDVVIVKTYVWLYFLKLHHMF